MDEPVIFFLFNLAENLSGFFRRIDLPPEPLLSKLYPWRRKRTGYFALGFW